MNIYDFTMYVNQDVDDTFSTEEIARWFNKAIANYNLIPPVTTYPYINMDNELTTDVDEFITGAEDTNATDGFIGAYTDYPLNTTFMLGVMLPYVISAVKGQESSITEKQIQLQEFIANSIQYKKVSNINKTYLLNQDNPELELYQVGEGAYITDFNQNPFAGDWKKATAYKEIIITRNDDNEIIKYVDDSLIDEEV